jgi:hypothetical protein
LKGVLTFRFVPRPTKEVAASPITSRQTLTHSPHKTHNSSASSGRGSPKREYVIPSHAAISRIVLECGQRLRRNSRLRRRAAKAFGESVSTTRPASTGYVQEATVALKGAVIFTMHSLHARKGQAPRGSTVLADQPLT